MRSTSASVASSFEERERQHHDGDAHNDAHIREVLVPIRIRNGYQFIETDEDHDPRNECD